MCLILTLKDSGRKESGYDFRAFVKAVKLKSCEIHSKSDLFGSLGKEDLEGDQDEEGQEGRRGWVKNACFF